ncbi:recombinase family protein [Listeria grandensis]|uniref:Recombinase family protein n=1 Tax=Listeria grandensis TaxID=1494963 RepID=A0A7X0Y6C3_9LIST|nr:recombinase family protein [Listeria grandensis]MBC1937857.1 recombinase family protein [Listeria grandensis]
MKIGYARVSSDDQNLSRQIEALKKAGAEKIFQEKKSGASADNREQLQALLKFARQEDIFVVEALDRLGRNYDEIIKMVQRLDEQEIGLIVLNLPLLENLQNADPGIAKLLRPLVIQLLSWVAETERNESKRRQAQGIAIAKEKGIYKGKPLEYGPDVKNKQKRLIYFRIVEMLNAGAGATAIASETGVARSTVYEIKKRLTN